MLKAIFAVNNLGGFAVDNTMPWPRNDVDMRRFKMTTSGKTVVMGTGTWMSDMPKPLPNRRNCVLSTTLVDSRCEIYKNITDLMMNISPNQETWVIGGVKILWTLRPYINEVHLTRFKSSNRADLVIDTDRYLDGFAKQSSVDFGDHTFDIYVRNQ